MNKPKIFVGLRSGYDLTTISDELSDRFHIHFWHLNRVPTLEEVKASVKGVFGIICAPGVKIDAGVVEAAGDTLKVVVTGSVGVEHLDVKTLRAKGIRIGYDGFQEETVITVAEYAIGLIFATARHIAKDYLTLRQNVNFWDEAPLNLHKHFLIWDSVVGIVGCGNIGMAIIKRLQTFSPKKMLYSSRKSKPEVDKMGGEWRSVDNLCKESDFIIITVELNEKTHHLINRVRLNSMKSNAILINVARGGVIEEKALVEALQSKKIAGAGLDVLEVEPIHPNHPLLSLSNVVVTPHLAWCSSAVMDKKIRLICKNILAVCEDREMESELL